MFTVSENACIRLAKKIEKRRTSDDEAMRLTRRRRGWKLRLAKPERGDVAFTHEGRTVLVLAAEAAELLADRTLDTRRASAGSRLYLRRAV
jgi:hypothetical protein